MHLPRSIPSGLLLAALGLSGVLLALHDPVLRVPCGAAAMACATVALGILGRSGRLARSLQVLVGQPIRVRVWDRPLPGGGDPLFRVASVSCLGVGLWIRLAPVEGGRSRKLKVAQPGPLDGTAGRWAIPFSGYVQWDSRRIPGPGGRRAPGTVVLLPD
jgi:hypothetical protein